MATQGTTRTVVRQTKKAVASPWKVTGNPTVDYVIEQLGERLVANHGFKAAELDQNWLDDEADSFLTYEFMDALTAKAQELAAKLAEKKRQN